MSKYCKRCDTTKADEAFYRMRRTGVLTFYCRDCSRQMAQASIKRNRDGHRQRSRLWRENNRERARELALAWAKRFPDKHAAKAARRRARKVAAEGSFTAADVQALFAEQQGACAYCRKPLDRYHAEHKTPLSRGGSNYVSNICLACPTCNQQKYTKTAAEFMEAANL